MPPIELGPARAISAIETRLARQTGARNEPAGRAERGDAELVASEALDPGRPPVDAERVALIREAVEDGTYPIVPAKVADAIIAAGLLLRNPK